MIAVILIIIGILLIAWPRGLEWYRECPRCHSKSSIDAGACPRCGYMFQDGEDEEEAEAQEASDKKPSIDMLG